MNDDRARASQERREQRRQQKERQQEVALHRRLEYLHSELERLRQDDPAKTFLKWCPAAPDVYRSLGRALVGNTHLQMLLLQDPVMSEADAQAIAGGLAQSKLMNVVIKNAVPSTLPADPTRTCIWNLLFQGVQASHTIQVLFFLPLPPDAVVSLGEALPFMLSLQKLFLERAELTQTGAHALARGISKSTVKSLVFRHFIQEQPEESGRIRQILYQGIESSQTVQELAFQDFPVGQLVGSQDALQSCHTVEAIAYRSGGYGHVYYAELFSELLVKSTLLQTLSMEWGEWDVNSLTLLAQGLSRNVSVTKLVLSARNRLGDPGLETLFARGLMNNSSLRHLGFPCCNMSDFGVTVVLRYLDQNPLLQSLSLNANQIGPEGALLLLRALQVQPEMQALNLAGNLMIGYNGLWTI